MWVCKTKRGSVIEEEQDQVCNTDEFLSKEIKCGTEKEIYLLWNTVVSKPKGKECIKEKGGCVI